MWSTGEMPAAIAGSFLLTFQDAENWFFYFGGIYANPEMSL